jgi:2-keto-4-pentenoate hydratase/2-oxohepta-3-ene-1,7-dioic acid hydratase in catechol pathway
MRLCSFILRGEERERHRAGVIVDSRVFELARGQTMIQLLESGQDLRSLQTLGAGHELDGVELVAPIPRPGKILATIVNTQGMLGGRDVSLDRPRLDMKAPSAVIGPGENILAPPRGIRPEVELGAVVGRRITRLGREQAKECILGYTILNDVTAPVDSKEDAYEAYRRDRATGKIGKATMRGPLFRSKNHDTFCPMGPWIVTADEGRDWSKLRMTTKFDGDLVQDGSTGEYLFDPPGIASHVSGFLTLYPGDVISCGSVGWTPAALGKLDPTEFVLPVRPGRLELEIEGIGKLGNPVSIQSGT